MILFDDWLIDYSIGSIVDDDIGDILLLIDYIIYIIYCYWHLFVLLLYYSIDIMKARYRYVFRWPYDLLMWPIAGSYCYCYSIDCYSIHWRPLHYWYYYYYVYW